MMHFLKNFREIQQDKFFILHARDPKNTSGRGTQPDNPPLNKVSLLSLLSSYIWLRWGIMVLKPGYKKYIRFHSQCWILKKKNSLQITRICAVSTMHRAGAWWLALHKWGTGRCAPWGYYTTRYCGIYYRCNICGNSQVTGDGLAEVPHCRPLRGRMGLLEMHIYISVWVSSPAEHFSPDNSSHKLDLQRTWHQTLQHNPINFCIVTYLHGEIPGCPRWEPGHHLRSWQKCCHSLGSPTSHILHLRAQTHLRSHCWGTESRERHTHTHKYSAQSQPSSSQNGVLFHFQENVALVKPKGYYIY